MGLLDDAIREHLDLKRRRGADPTEVEREEREVLGPVRGRRETAGDDVYESEHDDVYESEHDDVYESEHDDVYESERDREPLAPGSVSWRDEQFAPAEPETELYGTEREPEPYRATEPEPEPYRATERGPSPKPEAERDSEPVPYAADAGREPPGTGHPTVEYSVEDAIEQEDKLPREVDQEDVLEETPEFLQDTPDHDRLWFEQRPPRDFDFDG